MTRLLRSICFSLFLAALFSFNLTIAQQVQLGKNFTLSLGDQNKQDIAPEIKDMLHYYEKQIYFTENKGQWPSHVIYKADFPLGQALATKQGMLVGTYNPDDLARKHQRGVLEEQALQSGNRFDEPEVPVHGHGWLMNFLNSSTDMTISSSDSHSDKFNYFSSGKQLAGVNSYQEIWYNNVYDKVDVRYYPSEDGMLEYDIVCKPGFDKNKIAILYDGIKEMFVNADGELVLKTSVGEMTYPAPIAYQSFGKRKIAVEAKYVLNGNVVSFELGDYNSQLPLVIDPIALRWATWVTTGSANDDHGHGIWVSSDGSIYVMARFDGAGLITANAFDGSNNGGLDIVLGKYIEPSSVGGAGTRVWQTYIGGSSDENPYAIEEGPDGNLYMIGYTSSTDFPLTGGSAFGGASGINANENNQNAFVLKINPAGNSIKAALVGGNGTESPFDLRLTAAGDVLVCGSTTSTNLQTKYSSSSNANTGGTDVWVFKINQNLSAISWMKNYGGSSDDQATIMLSNNGNGDIFLGGYTSSSDFGMVNPRTGNNARGGSQAGFLQKLGSTGSIKWSSYFRSASNKTAQILCMEFNSTKSQLYFGGLTTGLYTTSPGNNISSSGAYDNSYNGDAHDFFVCRMDTNQNFVAGTYLGGSSDEINMMGLNVDQNNDVYIFGYSNSTNFPTTGNPLQSSNAGGYDKTFSKLKFDLSSLLFSTYYGGTADDYDPVGERGIKFSNCRIYTIFTSKSNNLPITVGAITSTKSGSVYEPGLAVWANPPDLINNTITLAGGNGVVCAGNQSAFGINGSVPSYSLPQIYTGNGTGAVNYPATLPTAATYQWQLSTDSTNWSNISGATNQNITPAQMGAISAKTFFRRIINGDACVVAGPADQVVTVKVVSVTFTISNVTCFGFNNGSLIANAIGQSPFVYHWGNGATTQTINNLSPGNYLITITDANGCSASGATSITQPTALDATISSTQATCGNANGTATVTPSGGTPGYTYLWSNGSTVSNPTGLLAGAYSVTVKDANLCSIVKNVTVNQATTLDATIVPSDVSCFGGSNGSINLTPSGGTPAYHFVWSNGATTEDISGLIAGSYSVTVTDANQCSKVKSAAVGQPNDILLTETHNDVSCNSGSNGSVDLTVTGGTAPYIYLWSNGNTNQDISGLAFGTYSVTVTDAHSCVKTLLNISIIQPSAILLIKTQVNNICFGGNTGSIDLSVSGGSPGYTYLWSNGATSQDISSLIANGYTVTVTDAHSCTKTLTTTITEPAYLETTGAPVVACESYNLPWNQLVTVTNTYDNHYTSVHGCDSLVHIHVTINHGTHNSETQTACESYSWHGITRTVSGVYTYNYNNAFECPSVDTLHLTINYGTHNSSTETACESYIWHGINRTVTGVYTYAYNNGDGCPSVDTLHLTINYGTHNSSTETACESYSWHGINRTVTGVYTYAYNNGDGCPSVDTLHLTINYGTHNSSTETACESYTWHGINRTVTGVYTYAYNNGDGCPSVDTLHLTINYGTHNSSTETACESYTWHGINHNASGVFTYSYNNGDGCPSVDTLHLTINYGTHNSSNETACESYTWHGINHTVTGVYTYAYNNGDGCPSVDTLHLTINYGTHNSSTETACESYSWHGINRTVTGVYTYSYNNDNDCPSVDTLHLTINYGTHNSSTETACESYSWHGINHTVTGVYTYAYNNGYGCPSVDTLHLTINYGTHNSSTETACENYNWHGINHTVTGVYTYAYNNGDGCPSVDTLHLAINYGTHNSSTETACESYTWHGISHTVTGIYTYAYNNGDGCPSVDTLHLTINYGTHNSSTETACESYSWHGINHTVTGVYTYAYNNGDGCPSVDTLHLTINYGTHNSESHTACETYHWNGDDYTSTGVFTYPYNNQDGCPSVDTLHLTITHGTNNAETHTACESYSWNGINYTVSGTYIHSYENQVECSSVDTLHLTIHNGTHNSETHTACESYFWNGINYTASGVFTYPYENGDGCPSVDTLHLTINYGTHNSSTETACESYSWHGINHTVTGVYTYSYNNDNDCPSVDTLHLTINYGTHNSSTETACESYTWHGINHTVTGVYTYAYNNGDGCPSVDTLHLTINYGTHNSATETACESYNWHGINHTVTGVYTYAYNNGDGCPSVDTLHLTINYGTHNSATETACESYNWHGINHTVTGVFTYAYNNGDGCPSVDTLHLTINYGTHNSSTETACESYNWHGINHTVTGVYTYSYNNDNDCPSVDTLHLTINYGTHNSETHTACETYFWNGFDYTVTGVFTHNYNNQDGCPSVDTLHLTINHGTHNSENHTSCESFNWHGINYTETGVATYTYENADGCASVDTLHLTITHGTNNSETHTACESYNWNGTSYTASGTYTHSYLNDCPSVDTLHLTIHNGTHNVETHTACESYNWNGVDYTVTGVYTHPYENADGCPSVDTLHMTINHGTHNSETHAACETYNWHGTDYTVTGVYTYPYYNQSECPSVDTLHLTINHDVVNQLDPVVACGQYQLPWTLVIETGNYEHHYTTIHGCDSLVKIHIYISHIEANAVQNGWILCHGGNNGAIDLTASHGIGIYEYNWSNGATTEDISGLSAGTYTVTVTDDSQCSSTASVEIGQPTAIEITHELTNASCNNANGGIDVTVTGGTAPYSYDWVNGATTEDLSGIASGDYTLVVTDANGCTGTSAIYVSGTPAISLSETHSNATCGQENANVFLTVTGGTAPFEFLWSNGSTTQNLAGVASGTYLVTVTDINGCPAVLQVDVDCTPPLCNMQLTYEHSNNECFGECDGTIDLTVIGGTMPFSYNWSNGGSGIHLINLCAGDYSVTVTDVNGCFAVANINITQHDPIVIVMDTSNSNCEHLCHCCTGAIIAFPSGGVGPYNYVWSNTATGSIAAGLCPGQYFVTVTDASGCTAVAGAYVDCITLPPPPPPPACQAPTNFTVTNVTSSSAILHWDAVPGAYGYKIRRRAVGTTTWVNTGVYAPAHQKTIQNLQCNTAYEWQIETLCNAEQTDVSAWVTNTPNFTTAPYCAMPTGLYVTNITSTSVIVHWTTVPNATSYRIRYKKHGTTTWTNVFASATATQKTILNLTPGVTYDWQLRAKCAGSGDVSAFSNSTIQHFTMLNGTREEDENGNASVPMSIFPNPTQSDLTVTLNNGCNCNDGATITITNVLGQTVYSTVAKLNNGQLTQEIVLPASIIDGLYFVTVRSNEYVETRKLTVGNK